MSWDGLEREIDTWAAAGRVATAWWRDDDAVSATPALDRLLRLTASARIPLALAVIPALAEESLAAAIRDRTNVTVLQHGYAHVNHAGSGMRAVECGGERPLEQVAAELSIGRDRLSQMFGAQFFPVLVPPWNRIDPALLPRLSDLSFRGVSTWDARSIVRTSVRFSQVNTHADPIAWRKGRVFAGTERVTEALTKHLAARRIGEVDANEATGLLTHHLAHDEPGWEFLRELSARLSARPGLLWLTVDEAFGRAR
jgi:hypothetical protein